MAFSTIILLSLVFSVLMSNLISTKGFVFLPVIILLLYAVPAQRLLDI